MVTLFRRTSEPGSARLLRRASALVVPLVVASLGAAQRAEGQTVTLGGGTPTVHITTAVAGSAPTTVSTTTTTLAYTNDNTGTKVLRARLASALPAGVTLQVSVSTPSGSTSLGFVTLTTSYQNLTGTIAKNASGTVNITHRLSATSAAGVQAASTRQITFQIF